MSFYSHAKNTVVVIVAAFLFAGCGYKPSSKFSREVVGDRISTSVTISSLDPENTVLVKDAVDEAIIQVFHASLTTKDRSDTHLLLRITNPTYTPIQFNEDGYVIGYRMILNLHVSKVHDGVAKEYVTKGTYDFSVTPNAIITDQERFEAIKNSAQKAISAFVAQVSAEGAKGKK